MADFIERGKAAASAIAEDAKRQVREEATRAVLPWVLLSIGLALYAISKDRR